MNIIIILIITALVAVYIALPFFLRRIELDLASPLPDDLVEDPVTEKLKSLNTQKENLYSAIKDIEFDYGLGKLSKEDFEELNTKYKSEAVSVLKEIDTVEKEANTLSLDHDLEQEILSYRKSSSITDADIENEISAFKASNLNCPSCGEQYSPEDLYCSKCGAQLNK